LYKIAFIETPLRQDVLPSIYGRRQTPRLRKLKWVLNEEVNEGDGGQEQADEGDSNGLLRDCWPE
jgi:hypothetical protein